ncbi:hypothetical protein bcgnr5372_27380 [Bacillus luti]
MSYCPECNKNTEGQPFVIPTVVPFFKDGEVIKWIESSLRCVSCAECKHVKSQIHNFDPEFPISYK